MNGYRRGAVLGLTVAETFILLTFLLLMALLGLVPEDEPPLPPDEPINPEEWPPERIETLVSVANKARYAREKAERERDQALKEAKEARRTKETAERERDEARQRLAKGKNPPCWYQTVSAGAGKTREKSYYAFNVAIYEDSILLAPRTPPPGRAIDDDGRPYAEEWQRLRIDELPYGTSLSDDEFTEAIGNMVAQGKNGQVRTYECVFSVMVWDMTPDHAKQRWQDAHDRVIEGSFSAYTVRDLEWTGVEPGSARSNRSGRRPMNGSG